MFRFPSLWCLSALMVGLVGCAHSTGSRAVNPSGGPGASDDAVEEQLPEATGVSVIVAEQDDEQGPDVGEAVQPDAPTAVAYAIGPEGSAEEVALRWFRIWRHGNAERVEVVEVRQRTWALLTVAGVGGSEVGELGLNANTEVRPLQERPTEDGWGPEVVRTHGTTRLRAEPERAAPSVASLPAGTVGVTFSRGLQFNRAAPSGRVVHWTYLMVSEDVLGWVRSEQLEAYEGPPLVVPSP